jgi:filamentous hemagglutinin
VAGVALDCVPLVQATLLNVPDNGNLRPAQAAAAAQIEPTVGTMQPYEGLPTSGGKTPDYKITNGPNAGKTVDMMYTTANLSQSEIDGMNRFFEQNMTVPKQPGKIPDGIEQIQVHFDKANIVVMDMRPLTPSNQQVL